MARTENAVSKVRMFVPSGISACRSHASRSTDLTGCDRPKLERTCSLPEHSYKLPGHRVRVSLAAATWRAASPLPSKEGRAWRQACARRETTLERLCPRGMLFGHSHTKRNGAAKLEKRSPFDRFVHSLDASEAGREHPDDRLGLHSSERGTDAEVRPEAERDRLGAAA